MSRTDDHRPLSAWLKDPGVAVERHDHSRGPCDLPSLDDWVHSRIDPNATTCYWAVADSVLYEHSPCGCEMCTSKSYRRRERRKSRHSRRSEIEQALIDYQADIADAVWDTSD